MQLIRPTIKGEKNSQQLSAFPASVSFRLKYIALLRPRTHGNVFLRFCIVSSNELVVLDSLENSK